MEELLITLDSYSLRVLKKIVQVHIQHLEEQIRNLQKFNTHSEASLDADIYFLHMQKIDAKFLEEVLNNPIRKSNSWMEEVLNQFTGTNGKQK